MATDMFPRMQTMALDEQSRGDTETRDREAWAAVVSRLCPGVATDTVVDWIESKARRMLLLGREHLVYLRWLGAGHSGNRVRWVLHLEHISSITSVAHTLVISHTTPVVLGPLRLELPRRHCLASARDNMADLLLLKVNRVLDGYFKTKLMRSKVTAPTAAQATGAQARYWRPGIGICAMCLTSEQELRALLAGQECHFGGSFCLPRILTTTGAGLEFSELLRVKTRSQN
jgi:hypothetical protein